MPRLSGIIMAVLFLFPRPSPAIQLHWISGASDLTFASATRCTLVVQADSTEGSLPATWRLQWTADSSGVQFAASDSTLACQTDTARVSSIDPPATPADSAANEITAHFCSDGNSAATAYFLVDLIGGSHGKLRAVALNPTDSTQVIESNEVTFNGGVAGDYAFTLLAATSIHTSLKFQLTAIGASLQGVQEVALTAPDGSWNVPLSITSSSDNSLTAVASLAALVPNSVVTLTSLGGPTTSAPLAADPDPITPESGGCVSFFREGLLRPATGLVDEIQPKDFAFVKGFVDTALSVYALHLFYTRQNQELTNNHLGEFTTKNTGHTSSTDFSWSSTPDTALFPVRPGHFENDHVWAPTVVLNFPDFFLFYTGVDSLSHQRIGVAKSRTLLDTSWVRADTAVFDVTKSTWAARGVHLSWVNCRDPFVTQDPDNPRIWLMYYVAVDSASVLTGNPQMAVGVARSYGDMYSWKESTELVNTMRPVFGN